MEHKHTFTHRCNMYSFNLASHQIKNNSDGGLTNNKHISYSRV